MFVIAGVSGNTGSVVAETLLAQGKPVRVIVRDAAKGEPWRARGAEVALASLDDVGAMTRALTGAQGAYLLVPPNLAATTPRADQDRLTGQLAAAVTAAAVPHVVLLSSVGAQHAAGTGPIAGLHVAEKALAATGAGVTAVRAAYFQENWGASLGMLAQGVLPTFLPADLRFAQVATPDIGKAAAGALLEPAPRGATRVIELAGPAEISADDVAAALSTITGAKVTAQAFPLDAVVPTFTSFGISAAVAELYREMYAGILAGHVAFEGGATKHARGAVAVEVTLRKLLGR